MSDEVYPRILYVGNLDPSVTEELLVTLFGQLGSCQGCKLIRDAGSDMYAFVEFAQHSDAQLALMAMNKRIVLGREMKVNWATSPGTNAKVDTSKHFHVFVGDLSQDVESHQLREAFAPFGEISDCKVIRDAQTHQSKGYAFICFVRQEDAEMAIASMNGQWIGGRAIRTNWANGKATVSSSRTEGRPTNSRALKYDDVFSQSGPTNCTVYCGNIQSDLTDELMRETFEQFGNIQDIRVFKDKGFAFIKMDSKDAATKAIVGTHGTQLNGYTVKCSWGKESDTASSQGSGGQQSRSAPQTQNYNQQQAYSGAGDYYGAGMAQYWGYPQQGGYPAQGGYPGMSGGYMQAPYGQQGYGYGNYGAASSGASGTGAAPAAGQWPGMQQNGQ
jgi:nucleolysin TIA-1/TIAR